MRGWRGAVVGLAVAVAACGPGVEVKTDYDPKASFAGYRTFYSEVATKWGNALGERRMQAAIDSTLTAKGWRRVGSVDEADVAVVIHGATQNNSSATTFYSGPSYWGGWGWGGWGYTGTAYATTQVYTYKTGSLVVDMFDVKTKSAIWRGTADAELSSNPEANRAKAMDALTRMFAKFPPGGAR